MQKYFHSLKSGFKSCFNSPRKWAYWMLGSVIIITVYFLILDRFAPSTDDATVQAYVINVTSYDSGKIVNLAVKANQKVKKNDLLFSLEKSQYLYLLNKAQAELALTEQTVQADQEAVQTAQAKLKSAQANFNYEHQHFQSLTALYKTAAISRDAFEQAQEADTVADQSVIQAQRNVLMAEALLGPSVNGVNIHVLDSQADLNTAKLNYGYTDVYAPANGYVANLQVRLGSYISAAGNAMTLIDSDHFWVQANFKENDLSLIQSGQPAWLTINNYPGEIFHSRVDSLGWGVNTPDNGFNVLLPTIDKTNNWVNLAQRFPVRMTVDNIPMRGHPLRVGATAIVTVFTGQNSIINFFASLNQWIRAYSQYLY